MSFLFGFKRSRSDPQLNVGPVLSSDGSDFHSFHNATTASFRGPSPTHSILSHNSDKSYKINTESQGSRDMTEDEVNLLVHNALRKARKATHVKPGRRSNPTSPLSNLGSISSLDTGATSDNNRRAKGIPRSLTLQSMHHISEVDSETQRHMMDLLSSPASTDNESAGFNPGDAVIRQVEEEIQNARRAAENAGRRLAGALSSTKWPVEIQGVRSGDYTSDENYETGDDAEIRQILQVSPGESAVERPRQHDDSGYEHSHEAIETTFSPRIPDSDSEQPVAIQYIPPHDDDYPDDEMRTGMMGVRESDMDVATPYGKEEEPEPDVDDSEEEGNDPGGANRNHASNNKQVRVNEGENGLTGYKRVGGIAQDLNALGKDKPQTDRKVNGLHSNIPSNGNKPLGASTNAEAPSGPTPNTPAATSASAFTYESAGQQATRPLTSKSHDSEYTYAEMTVDGGEDNDVGGFLVMAGSEGNTDDDYTEETITTADDATHYTLETIESVIESAAKVRDSSGQAEAGVELTHEDFLSKSFDMADEKMPAADRNQRIPNEIKGIKTKNNSVEDLEQVSTNDRKVARAPQEPPREFSINKRQSIPGDDKFGDTQRGLKTESNLVHDAVAPKQKEIVSASSQSTTKDDIPSVAAPREVKANNSKMTEVSKTTEGTPVEKPPVPSEKSAASQDAATPGPLWWTQGGAGEKRDKKDESPEKPVIDVSQSVSNKHVRPKPTPIITTESSRATAKKVTPPGSTQKRSPPASAPPVSDSDANRLDRTNNKIQFRHPYPLPPAIAKPRSASDIVRDYALGMPTPFEDWSKPKNELAQLLVAAKDATMGRRSNACGALKIISLKKKNQLALVRSEGFLDTIVYVMEQDIPLKDRDAALDARGRAVTTLLNVSEPKHNRTLVMAHPGVADALVKVIDEDLGEARVHACGVVAMLAKTPANREMMMKVQHLLNNLALVMMADVDRDQSKRISLLQPKKISAEDDDDEGPPHYGSTSFTSTEDGSEGPGASRFSVGVSSSVSSLHPQQGTDTPRKSVSIKRAKDEKYLEFLSQARVYACAALSHLSKHCAVLRKLIENSQVMRSLIKVSLEFENSIHTKCIEILCNMTRLPSNTAMLARNEALVDTLVKCGKSKTLQDRIWALRAFQNLSTDSTSKVILANSRILTLLSICAMRKDYDEQAAAVAGLYNLSTEPGAVVPLTNTKNVVATLVHLAHNTASVADVRNMACDALATIGLWLQTLAGSGTVPMGTEKVLLPSHTTSGWERWD